PAGQPQRRPLDDRRPLGDRPRLRRRPRDGRVRRSRPGDGAGDPAPAALARASAGLRLRGDGLMATAAVDKRRVILDAAVRVFARQGFHTCRVADIADEAGVAYGLVYHYFASKDAILDTL